jgi:hypothetical protein
MGAASPGQALALSNCCSQDHVRAWQQPSRDATSSRARAGAGSRRDVHSHALPGGPRGGALRAPPRLGLRHGVPPQLRRLPRSRQPALPRRVRRSLQNRGGGAARTGPARAAAPLAAALWPGRHRSTAGARRCDTCLAAEQHLFAAPARRGSQPPRRLPPPLRRSQRALPAARGPRPARRSFCGRREDLAGSRSGPRTSRVCASSRACSSRASPVASASGGSGCASAPPGTWSHAGTGSCSHCRKALRACS